jgi:soluble lytic murein transglycosylase-like protein
LLQYVNSFQFLGTVEESRDSDDQLSSIFGLHEGDDSSSLCKFVGDQAMSTRTQILVLSLAVGLLHGCASFQIPLLRDAAPRIESTQETQAENSSSEPSLVVEYEATLAAPAQQIDVQEENQLLATEFETGSKSNPEPASNPDEEDPRVKTPAVQNKPSVLKKVSGSNADDRLLDLLQKDIDKAVEQPIERRRIQFSKAVIEHARVRYFVNQFSKTSRESFAKVLARSGRYMPMITKILREEGLPEEFAYLALVESSFLPEATSPNGAAGLWQFVPSTARKYGLRIDTWVDERRDPVKSTYAAAAHLKDLHEYFGKWYLATAAYNAGLGAIDKAMQTPGAKNLWGVSEKAKLSDETRNFVPRFVAVSLITTNPEKYGFKEVQYEDPLNCEEVEIRGHLTLQAIATMAESSLEAIQELNPALFRNSTPPEGAFTVKLPAGRGLVFANAYERLREKDTGPTQVVTHEVRRGETLFSIARRYGQQVRSLMELNGLSSPRLRIGQLLKVLIFDGLRGDLR